jgi:hypothetical protein
MEYTSLPNVFITILYMLSWPRSSFIAATVTKLIIIFHIEIILPCILLNIHITKNLQIKAAEINDIYTLYNALVFCTMSCF